MSCGCPTTKDETKKLRSKNNLFILSAPFILSFVNQSFHDYTNKTHNSVANNPPPKSNKPELKCNAKNP